MRKHRVDTGFPPAEYSLAMFNCPERGRSIDLLPNQVRQLRYCPLCGEDMENVEIDENKHYAH